MMADIALRYNKLLLENEQLKLQLSELITENTGLRNNGASSFRHSMSYYFQFPVPQYRIGSVEIVCDHSPGISSIIDFPMRNGAPIFANYFELGVRK